MQYKRGFTLIELLVVISIIAILATLVFTQLGGARVRARNSAAKSDVTEMGKAVELFKTDDANASELAIFATGTGATDSYIDLNLTTSTPSTGSTAFSTVFKGGTGGNAATGAFYALAIGKTPGASQTYRYSTTAAAAANGQDRQANCYVVSTTVDNSAGVSDGWLAIKNGTSFNGAAGTGTPPYTVASNTDC